MQLTVNGNDTLTLTDQLPTDSSVLGGVTVTTGTLDVNGAASATSVTLNGGTLAGSGQVTDSGAFTWTAGYLGGGGGQLTVAGATSITAATSGNVPSMTSYALVANGTAAITNAGTTASFNINSSQLDADTSLTIAPGVTVGGSGAIVVPKGATMTAPTTPTGAPNAVTLNNYLYVAGSLTVSPGGTLTQNGGSSSGPYSLGAGSVLYLNNSTVGSITDPAGTTGTSTVIPYNSTVNGALTVNTLTGSTSGSTTYFNGAVNVANLNAPASQTLQFNSPTTAAVTTAINLSGGTISGSGKIADAGTFAWTAGYLGGGGGQLTVAGATSITAATSGNVPSMTSYALVANGTAAITNAGTTASFNINSSQLDADTSLTIAPGVTVGGSGAIVVPKGATMTAPTTPTGAPNAVTLNDYLYVAGSLTVSPGGTLTQNGGSSSGPYSLGAGSVLYLNNSTVGSITDPAGTTGTSTVIPYNSTVNGALTVNTLTGSTSGSTTYFNGAVNVANLNAPASQTLQFNSPTTAAVTTAINLSGGTISGSGKIADAGTFAWTAGYLGGGGGQLTVAKAGTITLSNSAATSSITTYALIANGSLAISGPSGSAAFSIGSGATIEANGSTATIGSGESINGNGAFVTSTGTTLTAPTSATAPAAINCYLYSQGPVTVPANASFSMNGGTQYGTTTVNAGSTLTVDNSTFAAGSTINDPESAASRSASLLIYNSTFSGTVAVGSIGSSASGGTNYFNGAITTGTLTDPNQSDQFNSPTPVTIGTSVVLSGGTIGGSGAVNDAGTLQWTSGYFGGGGGTITVAGKTTIKLSTTSTTYTITNYDLIAKGVAAVSAGAGAAGFNINGSAQVLFEGATASIDGGYTIGGSGYLSTATSTTLTAPTSTIAATTINSGFYADGPVTLPSGGTLTTDGYGSSSGNYTLGIGASLNVASQTIYGSITDPQGDSGSTTLGVSAATFDGPVTVGALVQIGNGTVNFNGTVDTGTLSLAGGTWNFSSKSPDTIAQGASLSSGTLGGSSTLNDAGTLTWTGGNFNGGLGTFNVAGATSATLSTASSTSAIEYFAVELNGPATFTAPSSAPGFAVDYEGLLALNGAGSTMDPGYSVGGTGTVVVGPSGTLTAPDATGNADTWNPAFDDGGAVTVSPGATLSVNSGYSSGSFALGAGSILNASNSTLAGPVTDPAGPTGTSTVNLFASTLSGAVTVGELQLPSSAGTSTVSGTLDVGTLNLASSTLNVSSSSPAVVATAITLQGGTIGGSGTIADAGTFTWTSGDLSGSGGQLDVAGSTTITLSTTTSTSYVNNYTLETTGAAAVTTAPSSPGFTLYGAGLIEFKGAATIAAGVSIGGNGEFVVAPTGSLEAPGGSGSVTVGPSILTAGSVQVPAAGTLNANSGIYETAGTVSVATSATLVSPGNTINVAGGTLDGTGTITTSSLKNSGGVVEGGTPGVTGILTLSGTYVQTPGGTLQATVGGSTPGSGFSQVVAASAQLAGTLSVATTGGFVPPFSSGYAVVSTPSAASAPTGTFGLTTPSLLGPRPYAVTYAASGVTVTSAAALTPTVTVSSSVNPSVHGQATTVTVTVSGSGATPTGSVTLTRSGSTIGSGALGGGQFAVTTGSLATGTASFSASYTGDEVYSTGTGSLSDTVDKASTTDKLTASPTSAKAGTKVKLTAKLAVTSPGAGSPTGTVTFKLGSKTLGSATLSGGAASLTVTTLPVGTSDKVTATYGGDANFNAAPAATVTIKITAASSPRAATGRGPGSSTGREPPSDRRSRPVPARPVLRSALPLRSGSTK